MSGAAAVLQRPEPPAFETTVIVPELFFVCSGASAYTCLYLLTVLFIDDKARAGCLFVFCSFV